MELNYTYQNPIPDIFDPLDYKEEKKINLNNILRNEIDNKVEDFRKDITIFIFNNNKNYNMGNKPYLNCREITTIDDPDYSKFIKITENEGDKKDVFSVNAYNSGDKISLCTMGTILKGGHQTRMIRIPTLLFPNEENYLETFCVANNMWDMNSNKNFTVSESFVLPELLHVDIKNTVQDFTTQKKPDDYRQVSQNKISRIVKSRFEKIGKLPKNLDLQEIYTCYPLFKNNSFKINNFIKQITSFNGIIIFLDCKTWFVFISLYQDLLSEIFKKIMFSFIFEILFRNDYYFCTKYSDVPKYNDAIRVRRIITHTPSIKYNDNLWLTHSDDCYGFGLEYKGKIFCFFACSPEFTIFDTVSKKLSAS